MRILVVSQSYSPEPTSVGPFTTGLAEHFAESGHSVVVATTFPHYPQWRWQDGTRRIRFIETINHVQVRRWRVILPRRPGSATWRLVFDMSMGLGMILNSIGVDVPDVVICSSPPLETAFVGILLGVLWRRPFVILAQDMPVQAGLAVGMLKPGRVTRLALAFEGALYRRATRVVTISARFSGQLSDLGVRPSSISYIPNWINPEAFRQERPSALMRSRLGASDGDFLVIHAGNMGRKQALEHVIETTGLFSKESRVRVALVGDGPQVPKLESDIAQRNLPGIRRLPLLPAAEVPAMLAASDVLLVSQRARVIDSVLPSKTLAYMASGKPIIAAVDRRSATADLIVAADCGLVVAPEDARALADGIEQLKRDPDMGRRLGSNGRRYAMDRFSKDKVMRKWDALLAEVTSERVAPYRRHQ
ncbi:MAG TPA: glycosyltransferase [Candidatus Acidoferrum sp.]|jgi:colanic acid biosynthesis glycosyl transferase WcaI|nr:glycosyltransferase [Candidatus Acidoferrum sp.]